MTPAPLTDAEREFAIRLANKVLDRVNADPDDDLATLARQFLRGEERAEKLRKALERVCDLVDSEADEPFDDAIRIATKALA